jgi:uncharacterized protein YfaS (alpha-2-macroglobulin family)
MDAFDRLNIARGALFQLLARAAGNGAFSLTQRSDLNEMLADPLAADHLLLAEARVRAEPEATLDRISDMLDAASASMRAVLAGANSRDERRLAINQADAACDAYRQLVH